MKEERLLEAPVKEERYTLGGSEGRTVHHDCMIVDSSGCAACRIAQVNSGRFFFVVGNK